jgi:hypothetical protein
VFTSDPAHHQLLSFIHQYDKSFVGLKPLSHSSLHTAASELPHYPDLFKFTGKVPCKIAAENIPGGGDFAVLDEVEDIEAVYQAKTFLGNRQSPARVSNFINGFSPMNGVNGLSVVVPSSEFAAVVNSNISPQIWY